MNLKKYLDNLFQINSESSFNEMSLFAFQYQYKNIDLYAQFVDYLNIKPESINHYLKIPFLPISFFKTHNLIANTKDTQMVFKSSGTSNTTRSRHLIRDLKLYESSFLTNFENTYGSIKDYCILALLPSYIENGDSSLVYMANTLIEKSANKASGFYLNNVDKLAENLEVLDKKGEKVLLLGVSYALLDLIENQKFRLKNTIVMETGGMKGRRIEMIREELHHYLKTGFGIDKIHSEYGMTELLSQAYSNGNGIFNSPPWMKIIIREINDPFHYLPTGQNGGINIIDLANIHSISFIETKDLGRINDGLSFEVLGRFDDSDLRGCNLLIA
jgi:phenylacetate-coenzyme A ligase PaaK-like adenylate-forming protein